MTSVLLWELTKNKSGLRSDFNTGIGEFQTIGKLQIQLTRPMFKVFSLETTFGLLYVGLEVA